MVGGLKKYARLEYLWLGAPVAVWFSFWPLIRLGQSDSMYFELSIAMIYLAVMALASIGAIWRSKKTLLRNKMVWLVGAFVVVSALGVLWTPNPVRGVLTAGVMGCMYLVFLGAVASAEKLRTRLGLLIKIYIVTAVIMSLLAIVQFFAGVWLGRVETLLCAGCAAVQFGFVRPNVFTIEPQFFGSLLLPAALWLSAKLMKSRQEWTTWAALGLVLLTLVLTLSRGALFAFAIGFVVLIFVYRKNILRVLQTVQIGLLALLVALGLQGLAAMINPSINESFWGAITKSVNQLTLGVVNIPIEKTTSPVVQQPEASPAESQPVTPAYDGYVEESTNRRLELSGLAIDTWSQSVPSMLFGVGIGGAGVAMSNFSSGQIIPREIVQNEYVEILLERGIVGAALFTIIIVGLLYITRHNKWLWAIIAAFLVQWNFFSGYPNALHIYLVFIAIAAVFTGRRGALSPAKRY